MITAEQIHEACNKEWNENYSHGEYCHEQSFRWGFQEGTMYAEKEVISKACEWLFKNTKFTKNDINDFRKAME